MDIFVLHKNNMYTEKKMNFTICFLPCKVNNIGEKKQINKQNTNILVLNHSNNILFMIMANPYTNFLQSMATSMELGSTIQ